VLTDIIKVIINKACVPGTIIRGRVLELGWLDDRDATWWSIQLIIDLGLQVCYFRFHRVKEGLHFRWKLLHLICSEILSHGD
jgi:hypothetical protein